MQFEYEIVDEHGSTECGLIEFSNMEHMTDWIDSIHGIDGHTVSLSPMQPTMRPAMTKAQLDAEVAEQISEIEPREIAIRKAELGDLVMRISDLVDNEKVTNSRFRFLVTVARDEYFGST